MAVHAHKLHILRRVARSIPLCHKKPPETFNSKPAYIYSANIETNANCHLMNFPAVRLCSTETVLRQQPYEESDSPWRSHGTTLITIPPQTKPTASPAVAIISQNLNFGRAYHRTPSSSLTCQLQAIPCPTDLPRRHPC